MKYILKIVYVIHSETDSPMLHKQNIVCNVTKHFYKISESKWKRETWMYNLKENRNCLLLEPN